MSEGTSITIAGDWAKPAETLITKVSDAIGAGFKPRQIKRVAKAEAEAKVTAAEADLRCRELVFAAEVEPTESARRAMRRMIGEEIKRQENIESILLLAAERLQDNSNPSEVEDDFIADLFDKAKNTSNFEMQSLWASLLAGEADRPGRFSKRTIVTVSELDRRDAELFTKFCSCCWMLGSTLQPFLMADTKKIFEARGIGFSEISHLSDIGLISFEPITGFSWESKTQKTPATIGLQYFSQRAELTISTGKPVISVGHALFTKVGAELATISGATFDEELRNSAISGLKAVNRNIKITF